MTESYWVDFQSKSNQQSILLEIFMDQSELIIAKIL